MRKGQWRDARLVAQSVWRSGRTSGRSERDSEGAYRDHLVHGGGILPAEVQEKESSELVLEKE